MNTNTQCKEKEFLSLINSDGEIVRDDIPLGSKIITPQEIEYRQNKIKDRNSIQVITEYQDGQCVKTYVGDRWLFVKHNNLEVIKPETLCKLIFLSTYIDYSGKLMMTENIPVYKDDLPEILGITKVKMYDFLDETSPEFIHVDENNSLSMNSEMFYRGRLKKKMYNQYIRAYFDGVRSLYNSVSVRKHRQLGYIFQMLPYLNRTFNVLCVPEDIFVTNADAVRTIGFGEFCDMIGYDRNHSYQLKKAYKGITFTMKNKVKRDFVRIIDEYDKIYVNPRIFYAGRDFKKVEGLGTLFS